MKRIALAVVLLVFGQVRAQETWSPPVVVERKTTWFVRHDEKGKILWATLLEGEIGGQHVVWDEHRVYLSHNLGVTVLDAKTGRTGWHQKEPTHGLLLSGELLLGTSREWKDNNTTLSCWLFACDKVKGTEVFKAKLPAGFGLESVKEVAGLFLLQRWGSQVSNELGREQALLFDRKGNIRHRFDRRVIDGKKIDNDAVFLTGTDLVRISAKNETIWKTAYDDSWGGSEGGLVELPADKDLVVFRYGPISDSGVDVIRFNPADGKVKWKVHCSALGVDHSKYRHAAVVAVEGEKLRVKSKGSFGKFEELLDLRTGRQLARTPKKPE